MPTPLWYERLSYAKQPPFYGLGAVRLSGRKVYGFDTETYAAPQKVVGDSTFWRRAVPRHVCSTWAGRGLTDVPEAIAAGERRGLALVLRNGKSWKALVARPWTAEVARSILSDREAVTIGHNLPFDLLGLGALDAGLFRLGLHALAESRATCTEVRERLIAIATGQMADDDGPGRSLSFNLAEVLVRYGLRDRRSSKKGDDVWRVRYHELDGVPLNAWPEDAIMYAMDDAEDALELALVQAPIGAPRVSELLIPFTTDDGGVVNEVPQVRAYLALQMKRARGLRVDGEAHRAWGRQISAALDAADTVARGAGFLRPDGSVDTKVLKALVEADFADRGLEVPRTEPSGKFPEGQTKTDKETLVSCKSLTVPVPQPDGTTIDAPALKVWGEAAFLRRMSTTYFGPASLGVEYAMLYSFNILVATGRTSSYGPNMQNPPRDGAFRELFVPRPGYVFCSTDYASEELRTLAQLHVWWFGRSALGEVLNEPDGDPHAMFGAKLAGVDYATFLSWKKDPQRAALFKMYRQAAKAANFGLPGGLGAETFIEYARATYGVDLAQVAVDTGWAEGHGWSLRDVAEDADLRHDLAVEYVRFLKREWFSTWAEAKPYMDDIGDDLKVADTMTYLHPVSWRQRGGCVYTAACNTGFQGLAADAAKEALWRLAVLCYVEPEEAVAILEAGGAVWKRDREGVLALGRALYGCYPVLFIHDEVIVEGPEETAHEWAMAQAAVMSEAAEMFTPDVRQYVEPALMRRWYKGAEPVFVDGRLVPWEPKKK